MAAIAAKIPVLMSGTEWKPTEVLIPSLPNDVALNILARLPKQYDPVLSAVSKSIRSAVSSPHFSAVRSFLNRIEATHYLKVGSHDHSHDCWYAVHRNPNPNPIKKNLLELAPVPLIPVEKQPVGSAYAAVGSKIYVIDGYMNSANPEHSSDVWVLDCRSHVWERGPSMRRPLLCASAAAVDGKVYVVGSRREKLWVEVLDPAVGRWDGEDIPCPFDGIGALIIRFKLVDGKIFIRCRRGDLSFDPTTKKWEKEGLRNKELFTTENRVVDVGGVKYSSICSERKFEISYRTTGMWKELEGVAEGKPKYMFSPKLLNFDGRLVVVFAELGSGKTVKRRVWVWCAEVDVQKNEDGDRWGRVLWSEKVPLLPELTWGNPEENFYQESLVVYFCECLSVSL